jgi:hypothetical protein
MTSTDGIRSFTVPERLEYLSSARPHSCPSLLFLLDPKLRSTHFPKSTRYFERMEISLGERVLGYLRVPVSHQSPSFCRANVARPHSRSRATTTSHLHIGGNHRIRSYYGLYALLASN